MKLIAAALLGLFVILPSIALACPPGYYNCGGSLCCPK
ncbi:hypothetical protein TRM7615_03796 [Falsiruegeria mediterranea M17]|uniref:Uncharacterized protein n=1 Tax=Falsiruegeria mediterranea M17 TaxID=1200281 RepID=A0A2R8CCX0_9RHOB|nr:hypothetical protein TRM7615_03796 [Falsiruegeria mediterranea M17]